jgi:hypothetical protein
MHPPHSEAHQASLAQDPREASSVQDLRMMDQAFWAESCLASSLGVPVSSFFPPGDDPSLNTSALSPRQPESRALRSIPTEQRMRSYHKTRWW